MCKHCLNICKLRLCHTTESTNSACMRTIVTAALQQQYSQTELTFWIPYVHSLVKKGMQNLSMNFKTCWRFGTTTVTSLIDSHEWVKSAGFGGIALLNTYIMHVGNENCI